MRRPTLLAATVLLAAPLAGCSHRSSGTFPTEPPPHGGMLLTLPGGRGFAELLVEQPPARSGKDAGRDAVIVAYFLQGDRKSPLEPAPKDVRVAVASGPQVPLTPRPHPEDPSKAGQFASGVGKYGESGALSGELHADLGGEAVDLPFAIR